MIINGKEYLTEKEIAFIFGYSVSLIKKIRYEKKDFPYYKLRNRVYFNLDEVNKWFENNLKKML